MVFVTHLLGLPADIDLYKEIVPNALFIEDVCESHGATKGSKKAGTFSDGSTFSFYFGHHMTTIEGGMVCTNDKNIYQMLRMFRSHGMLRESNNDKFKKKYIKKHPLLNPKFIFAYPGYNMRNTEIGAIIGLNQLKTLDRNIQKRNNNHATFLQNIDQNKFRANFDLQGSSNYAFNLILKEADDDLVNKLMNKMDINGIEHRRGSSGGGNQTRQPYLKKIIPQNYFLNFPETEHIHFYGFYLGNYPSLKKEDILKLCNIINAI